MKQQTTSTAAVVSLVCGIASFCLGFLAGIPAVIAGMMGLSNISQSRDQIAGRGMAITGISLGVAGSVIQIIAVIGAALIFPAVQQARDAARRQMSMNNLKQIGLALHTYHDAYGQFPAGGFYKKDRAYHGWQVMLLPYVDQLPLYKTVDFNNPWDDSVNANAFQTQVSQFMQAEATPTNDDRGYALSHYAGNVQCFAKNSGLRIRQIKDGTSNTLFVGEVAEGFKPWGDPTNLRDPANGLNKGSDTFGRPGGQGCQFLCCDGAVRFISNDIDPTLLHDLATPAGGEIVNQAYR